MKKKKTQLIIFVLLILLITAVCYIGYDKLIDKGNNNSTNNNIVDTQSEVFKAIKMTTTAQTIQLKNSTLIVRVEKNDGSDVGRLYINDNLIRRDERDLLGIAVENAYYTDDFVFFTLFGQVDNYIVYALDDDGNELMINDNNYQMHDIKYENDKIVATGVNILSDDKTPIKLLIKYENDSIIVEPYN